MPNGVGTRGQALVVGSLCVGEREVETRPDLKRVYGGLVGIVHLPSVVLSLNLLDVGRTFLLRSFSPSSGVYLVRLSLKKFV